MLSAVNDLKHVVSVAASGVAASLTCSRLGGQLMALARRKTSRRAEATHLAGALSLSDLLG